MADTKETADPTASTSLQRHGELSAVDAEQFDASSTDKSPTFEDKDGNALTSRGINVSVAGLLKVDMAGGGGVGVILYVTQGNNAHCVSKVYTSGSDSAVLAGHCAFLY